MAKWKMVQSRFGCSALGCFFGDSIQFTTSHLVSPTMTTIADDRCCNRGETEMNGELV
jgi:hypothetical protein